MEHKQHESRQSKREVIIYHSNDLHSKLEQAAKIATIIKEGRSSFGDEQVIAVDLGDHMDRARMETEGTDGFIHRALLEATGYDVVTLGNNEGLTFTSEQLDHVYSGDHAFQVICCNIQKLDGQLPSWLARSTIIERAGIRIGFVAATANFAAFYKLMGWETLEPVAEIQKEVEHIREHCDVIVLLSHLGIRLDERIADECQHIDVILGAHTHHLFDPPQLRNGVLLCAAEKFGSYVGKVVIRYDEKQRRYVVAGEVIATAAYSEDQAIRSIIEQGKQQAMQRLSRVITVLQEPLEASDYYESALPNLLAIGLKEWCQAEIGIVNSGQLLGGLAVGPVTAGELHAICPSPINPCLMLLKGEQLLEALEQSLLQEFQEFKPRGFGFRGEQLGMLAVDGLQITYSLEQPPMQRITAVLVNDEALDLQRSYRVASIDMFTFNIGYKSLSKFSEVSFYLPEFIRNIIEEELKNRLHIEQCKINRWKRSGNI
ncbi:putative metallophosphoesterase YunD [Paenibacillus montaniterrae]|uniref:Metallophosphoesterase YunD n=1 Tax=Paenibacillus montaniterrae TaxID=429341 RepID=A0A919YLN3_9BACL|nr:bifunctional UDP-sugar hydrolase/5'-nucleotidase [Paenibacillus montaniterrae]GIP15507.1 putative metallophosphoesterase YunD [Paenibacillus montaniterrae]